MKTLSGSLPPLYHLSGFYEPVSAISHLFGAVLFLWLGALLLRKGRGDPLRLAVLGIYAFSCVLLFAMSGVYHQMVRGGTARAVMERLDHGAIFILIAGTFTPIHGILFRGRMRWLPLALIWGAAIMGITFKAIFLPAFPEWIGLSFYLALGWLGAGTGFVLWRIYGFAFIRPLVLGGIAYSVGAVSEYLGWPVVIPGVLQGHEAFHLAVLVGALLHWGFIWRIAAREVR
jgi:channel protein (hemolysin III family)